MQKSLESISDKEREELLKIALRLGISEDAVVARAIRDFIAVHKT
jgi:hypothetical protein